MKRRPERQKRYCLRGHDRWAPGGIDKNSNCRECHRERYQRIRSASSRRRAVLGPWEEQRMSFTDLDAWWLELIHDPPEVAPGQLVTDSQRTPEYPPLGEWSHHRLFSSLMRDLKSGRYRKPYSPPSLRKHLVSKPFAECVRKRYPIPSRLLHF